MVVDHIVPLCLLGADARGNWSALCRKCNRQMGIFRPAQAGSLASLTDLIPIPSIRVYSAWDEPQILKRRHFLKIIRRAVGKPGVIS